MLAALETGGSGGKHMLASLMGKGSIVMIGVLVGLAVVAAVVVYVRTRKKKTKAKMKMEMKTKTSKIV
ncbi:MAG: hypothetical protein IKT68_00945 [Clostridia bacterium]|nr:hypothetical protein [Clostridia bacterium]